MLIFDIQVINLQYLVQEEILHGVGSLRFRL